MQALCLLATLKKTEASNTQVLCEFLAERFRRRGVEMEIVRLVDHHILPGTYADMGAGDAWPKIFEKIQAADILIFATPIWWGGQSSEMQRVIERLDAVHDEILLGKPSRLEDKIGGIVITGDSDGAQHVIGNLSNFMNNIGVVLPPYASLSVLWHGQDKGSGTTREQLMEEYVKDYLSTADTMVTQIMKFLQRSNLG